MVWSASDRGQILLTEPTGDNGRALSGEALRACFGQFATGVTIVTVRDGGGAPRGITMNSFSSVSLDPPLVLFCLGRAADNFDDFLDATSYAVNLLGQDQQELSVRFANSRPDPWAGVPWDEGLTGAPLLRDRIAALECRPDAQHEGGDHVIIVAQVEQAYAGNGAPPLVYWRSVYRGLDEMRAPPLKIRFPGPNAGA